MWSAAVVGLTVLIVWLRWRRSQQRLSHFLLFGVTSLYVHLWHRWSCERRAEWPARGPFLVIVNHTCSADPSFIQTGSKRPLSFLVADEHYAVHPLVHAVLAHLECVPVDRNGKDARAAREALRRLEKGLGVCVFPEGNLSGVARNQMSPPKHGAAYLALRTRVPVYPVYIAGGPHTEELLKSWLSPSRRAVHVIYGPPIDLSDYYGRPLRRRLIAEVAELLMCRVRELAAAGEAAAQLSQAAQAPSPRKRSFVNFAAGGLR